MLGKMISNEGDRKDAKLKRIWQAEAVNVGHAKWIVDKKGNLKFKWLATQTAKIGEKDG